MSTKKPRALTGRDPGRDPFLRVQVTIPRPACWMVTGALVGNLNDLGRLLDHLGRLLH